MKDYQQQAADFLAKHKIKFLAKLANTKRPSWDNNRKCNHFRVTLCRGKRRISFDFFDSPSNLEKGINQLDVYSVLACCSSEFYCPDSFEDFCSEFGYDDDSRKAEKTYKELSKFSAKLQKFFDSEAMRKELMEIR